MFIEAIVISIILGSIRGGKLRKFRIINSRNMWIFIFGMLIQYILHFIPKMEDMDSLYKILNYERELQIISHTLILIGILLNLRFRSLWAVFLGYGMNFLVLMTNNWRIPNLIANPIINNVKFPLLANTILFSDFYIFPKIISMGDIVIGFGIFAFVQEIMLSDSSFMKGYKF